MRNLIIILLFAVALPAVHAQRSVSRFMDKYYDKEDVTIVDMSGFMLKVAAKFLDEENGKEILASINRLQVMVMDGENHVKQQELAAFKKTLTKSGDFEPLMMVRDGRTTVDFLINEKDGVVKNILLLVSDDSEFILLNLRGKLRFKDLKKLDFDVNGSEHFKRLPTLKDDVPRA